MTNSNKLEVIRASLELYPLTQNMARFYVYELSRCCGQGSKEWSIPENGLYDSFDFKRYFLEDNREAYIIKYDDEYAGFALLNQETTSKTSRWNMGEFFILARFQKRGLGKIVAGILWDKHPGVWEVCVIPENISALKFWRKAIEDYGPNRLEEDVKRIEFDKHQPNRIVFTFET